MSFVHNRMLWRPALSIRSAPFLALFTALLFSRPQANEQHAYNVTHCRQDTKRYTWAYCCEQSLQSVSQTSTQRQRTYRITLPRHEPHPRLTHYDLHESASHASSPTQSRDRANKLNARPRHQIPVIGYPHTCLLPNKAVRPQTSALRIAPRPQPVGLAVPHYRLA